jgi:threonine dehydrogenase-like Zn-dependent dehydrogenase
MALSLELFRSAPRYLAARAVGGKAPGLVAGPLAPLRLASPSDPEPRGDGWTRVKPLLSGICGSDLATLGGKSSFYFSPLVSLPFVPGHEVVGEVLDDVDGFSAGDRVVLASVLACAARGLEPCANCRVGLFNRCDSVATGDLKAGLQTGYCADTGGGWSRMMLAHRSQLHPIPTAMDDRVAVLVEPFACAIHSAIRANIPEGGSVFIVGAGTVGILTLLAVKLLSRADHVIVAAKHARQRAAARLAGADVVVVPDHAVKAVRRSEHAMKLTPERGMDFLLGGVDVSIESTGSKGALDLALRTTKAGGRVVLSGIPGPGADLTPVWFRELELAGSYTSGTEHVGDVDRNTFDLAIELASGLPMLADMVGAIYPLDRWREAIDHALGAGRLGTFKVAFGPQET